MVFFSKESFYDRTREDSAGLTVERAVIREPGGGERQGVAFRNGGHPKFVIDAEAAHRIAVALVDVLEEAKRHNRPIKRQTAVSQAFEALGDV